MTIQTKLESFNGERPDLPPPNPNWQAMLDVDATGKPRPTLGNVCMALRNEPSLHGLFRLNEFANEVVLSRQPPFRFKVEAGTALHDVYPVALADFLQQSLKIMAAPWVCMDAITVIAKEWAFDPVRAYLDGVHATRDTSTTVLDSWGVDHLGTSDTPLMRAMCRKFLIGAVARVFIPGCQVDTMPVFEGLQGLRKSSAMRALFGSAYFSDVMPGLNQLKAASEQLRGMHGVELAEMAAVTKADVERIKSFLSTRVDRYRPAYGRMAQNFPRRSVFMATLNPAGKGYLSDPTGARRFWPIPCGVGWAADRRIDVEAIEAIKDQLWGEAVAAFLSGERWYLDSAEFEAEQAALADERLDRDAWHEEISDFVDGLPWVRSRDVFGMLRIALQDRDQRQQNRVAHVMASLRWTRGKKWVEGQRERVFLPPDGAAVTKPAPTDEPDDDLQAFLRG